MNILNNRASGPAFARTNHSLLDMPTNKANEVNFSQALRSSSIQNLNSANSASVNSSASNNPADLPANNINDMFMKLLIAQIKNQDPLNPKDGTEYVSQLAQLTQIKSTEKVASLMQQSASLIDNLQTFSAGNLVGQQIMVNSDTIQSDGKTKIKGRITLAHPCNQATVILKDAAGKEHKIELGKQKSGQVDFTIDPKKLDLVKGKYTLTVATDSEEKKIPIEVGGQVTSVRVPHDSPLLQLNIKGVGEIAYNNISQFGSLLKSHRA